MNQPFTIDQLSNASIEDIVDQAFVDARRKRDQIIEREGDADGKRLTVEYFDQLVWEEMNAMITTQHWWNDYQNTRKSSAKTDHPPLLPMLGLSNNP